MMQLKKKTAEYCDITIFIRSFHNLKKNQFVKIKTRQGFNFLTLLIMNTENMKIKKHYPASLPFKHVVESSWVGKLQLNEWHIK